LKFGAFIGRSRKREPANGGEDDTAGSISASSFQDLLLGNLANYQEEQTLNPVGDRWSDGALYVQDTWKIKHNLTLDLGLRWQYLGQVYGAHDNIATSFPIDTIPQNVHRPHSFRVISWIPQSATR